MSKLMVVYKIGSKALRFSPKETINGMYDFASQRGGKMLYCTNRFPIANIRDDIKSIIILFKNCDSVIKADIDYTGIIKYMKPFDGYELPSVLNGIDLGNNYGWFALSNVEKITLKEGDYSDKKGVDLVKRMNGHSYIAYVEI